MDVHAALLPFGERMISTTLSYVEKKLGIEGTPVYLPAQQHVLLPSQANPKIFHGSLTARIIVVKQFAQDSEGVLAQEIATIEYLSMVRDMFPLVLMNKTERITSSNVAYVRHFLNFRLKYFERMRTAQLTRKCKAAADDAVSATCAGKTKKAANESTSTKKRKRSYKDPKAPKKQITALTFFNNTNRGRVKQENTGTNYEEVVSSIFVERLVTV
jgi:hypothetical protein